MKPFLDIINLTIKVYNFEMSYEDYSRKVQTVGLDTSSTEARSVEIH